MAVRKAVIPAAGWGTRMLPAAKAIPKEMLPVLDRPTIQYVVEEAAGAGIEDVLLVTSREKKAIEDHFDRNAELDARLKKGGKEKLLASIDALMQRARVHSVRQGEQRGLGDAVGRGRHHVGDEPFLCLLGDTIFSGALSPAAQLVAAHARLGTSVIGLEAVPAEKVSRYGIVGGTWLEEGVMRLTQLVEKPAVSEAPSRYAIAARYVLTPSIFDCIDRTPTGAGGEIQLTDALSLLMGREAIHGVVLSGQRHDIGDVAGWLRTNLIFAAGDGRLRQEVMALARQLGLAET